MHAPAWMTDDEQPCILKAACPSTAGGLGQTAAFVGGGFAAYRLLSFISSLRCCYFPNLFTVPRLEAQQPSAGKGGRGRRLGWGGGSGGWLRGVGSHCMGHCGERCWLVFSFLFSISSQAKSLCI